MNECVLNIEIAYLLIVLSLVTQYVVIKSFLNEKF